MRVVDRAQALVVGSGAGGAVTALELSRAGLDVLVVEEGGRFGLEDYGRGPLESIPRFYRRQGMTPILGPVPIAYVEGRGLGGSTEINSGFWQRTPEPVLQEWASEYGLLRAGPEELAPHFAWAEDLLQVGPPAFPPPPSTRALTRGLEALGWAGDLVPRAARACQNANLCASGCPHGAKQGMSRAIIPAAESHGARVRTDGRVLELIRDGGRVSSARVALRREDGSEELAQIAADHFFICGGATETPSLLRRGGVRKNVGGSLRLHLMLKVVARFDEEMDAEHTVLPLVQVKEFWPEMTLGGAYFSRSHLALLLSDNWPERRGLMRERARLAAYYVAVRSSGQGLVRPGPIGRDATFLFYRVTARDLDNLSRGLARLCRLLFAGGATEVHPCVSGMAKIINPDQARRWERDRLPAGSLSLVAVHAFASCPTGERGDRCAADSFGKIHGLANLYINDASMLPSSPSVNPQASIMALARRNALAFGETLR